MIHIVRRSRATRITLVQAKLRPIESGCFRSDWRISGAPLAHGVKNQVPDWSAKSLGRPTALGRIGA